MALQARDVLRNSVKDKLARGELVASMTVRIVPGVEIAGIARTAGFDTLYIDLELAACRKRGKHVGVGGLSSRPDLVEKYVRMGARYVSTGTDLAFLMAECARRARQVKDLKL